MKVARMLVAVAAAMLLAACASNGASLAQRAPRDPTTDVERVARIEKAAFQRGIQLVWVNPPDKRRASRDTY